MNGNGCVYLVGAGPGDPDLLTVKAARLLRDADAVVYDRLVSAAILDLVPQGVSRIFVGKRTGSHPVPQEEINRLLAGLAGGGRRVVRLKGGDPLVFGRGGEEAHFLASRGIAFEIVPGLTAAVACAAYAGIPLTQRGLATGVTLVTGHCRAGESLELDWHRLADSDTTLVVYMPLAHVAEISARLQQAGMAADTPAAAIECGTTPSQRRVVSPLAGLPAALAGAGLEPPTLLIIGAVAGLAGTLDWFSPLAATPDRTAVAHA